MQVITLQSLSCLAVLKPWLWTGAHGDLGTDASGSQTARGKRRGRKSQLSGKQKLISFLQQGHIIHCALDEVVLPLYSQCQNHLLRWGGERSISEYNGTQGWLSSMSYITKSSSTFLVMVLSVRLLPPFMYSQPGSLQHWRTDLLPQEISDLSDVPCCMIFTQFLRRISAPGSGTGAVVIKMVCVGRHHLGHLAFGEVAARERGHCSYSAYPSSLCCEPVAALWQGFICD